MSPRVSDPNFDSVISLIAQLNTLFEGDPEAAKVLQDLQSGDLSPEEATVRLFSAMQGNSGLISAVETAAEQMEAVDPGFFGGMKPVFMESSTGITQMNPVYEAAIAERASLDGDVPELRHGPLPDDGQPAVPVVLADLNPVKAGLMLEYARETVLREFQTAYREHVDQCKRLEDQAVSSAVKHGLDVEGSVEVARKMFPPRPTGTPSYPAGKEALKMTVPEPSSADLVALSTKAARKMSYQAIATTQGRVSLTDPISAEVTRLVQDLNLKEGAPTSNVETYEWVLELFGPEDLSENFNYARAAAQSLAEKLRLVWKTKGKPFTYQIKPYNNISSRRFGWVVEYGESY